MGSHWGQSGFTLGSEWVHTDTGSTVVATDTGLTAVAADSDCGNAASYVCFFFLNNLINQHFLQKNSLLTF